MKRHKQTQPLTRREALCRMGGGMGFVALANMLTDSLAAAETKPVLHHKARAKRVIFLFMNGGLSSIDSFDYKPALEKFHGQPLPGGEVKTERKTGTLLKSPFAFKQYGPNGMWVSELFPHVAECTEDICFIRSMQTDIPNHEPSLLMMNTGHTQVGRPSMGAWLTYGLGTSNRNLPGFVVLCPEMPTVVGPPLWSAAFLPPITQGTFIPDRVEERAKDFDPKKLIPYLYHDANSMERQKAELELLSKLEQMQGAPGLESSLATMETAFRMQTEAPEVFDIRKESEATQKLYGPGSTARGCLMGVRLLEKGVRMVQIYYAKGDPWDAHMDILDHRKNAKDSDQPYAAVIKDLKARGMLDETLVVCGSEFGRTPVVETGGNFSGARNGRDHNPFGFTMWLAGGGVKGGMTYGATDDFGFKAVEKPVHVHDLHATILHLLGIDHTKLTYRYSGRDFRLTDVAGSVLHEIIA